MKSLDQGPPCEPPPELVTREQLAARWVVSVQTIKRMEAEGILTPVRIGPRLVRYRFAQVLKIEAGRP
jgi:hypothetical protein